MSLNVKFLSFCSLGFLVASAAAVEPRLRLGPHEANAEVGVVSKYVDKGVARLDTPSAFVSASARVFNIGISADSYLAIEDDRRANVSSGEIGHLRARVDYLIDIPDLLQILPYYETEVFPATGTSRSFHGNQRREAFEDINPFSRRNRTGNPHYVGVDAWFLLPWEGMEVGGGAKYDVTDKAGWRGAVGARQFIQIGTLDLAFYELLHIDDRKQRDWLIGVERGGLATLEAGVSATIPLPFEYFFLSVNAAGHYWLDNESRRTIGRRGYFVAGMSLSFRTTDLGF